MMNVPTEGYRTTTDYDAVEDYLKKAQADVRRAQSAVRAAVGRSLRRDELGQRGRSPLKVTVPFKNPQK